MSAIVTMDDLSNGHRNDYRVLVKRLLWVDIAMQINWGFLNSQLLSAAHKRSAL